jgi:RimJ/RimL family protein N-acetyltransferase
VEEVSANRIRLVPFSRDFLDRSWEWLNDPEVKALTMTPDFTREDQLAFFGSLPGRTDYCIWGVEASGGTPIGAAGIKHIAGDSGESWCYIGERDWRGKGVGRQILERCEDKARVLGLRELSMKAAATNDRSIGLYASMGFVHCPEQSTGEIVTMIKRDLR